MFEGDEFEEFRLRSYSGGLLPSDSRKRAIMRCKARAQKQRDLAGREVGNVSEDEEHKMDTTISGNLDTQPEDSYHHSNSCDVSYMDVALGNKKQHHHPSKDSIGSPEHNGMALSSSLPEKSNMEDPNFNIVVHELIEKLEALKHSESKQSDQKNYGDYQCKSPRTMINERYSPGNDDLVSDWLMGEVRPRVYSMPTRGSSLSHGYRRHHAPPLSEAWHNDEPLQHRVRSFTITSHGLVSKGDIYVSHESSDSGGGRAVGRKGGTSTSCGGSQEAVKYHVGIQGVPVVGKTSIINSFIKTEISGASFASSGRQV